MEKIVNLQTPGLISDMHQPEFDGVKAMFIHAQDDDGNPTKYEIKQYWSYLAEQEQAEVTEQA